jgi:fatty-acyl-CoA synthase
VTIQNDCGPTLLDRIPALASLSGKGHRYREAEGREHHRSYAELVLEARRVHAHLTSQGLASGDRLAVLATDARSFMPVFLGCVLARVIPVPMCPPFIGGRESAHNGQLRRIVEVAGAKAVVIPESMEPARAAFGTVPTLMYESLQAPIQPAPLLGALPENDICFLQFTSGSTGVPKGVVVTHRNLAANARAIYEHGIAVTDRDVGVSWLPLFHDMGLVGMMLGPLIYQTNMVCLSTASFIKSPNLWLETISQCRGTFTIAPNFAFALATRHFKRRPRPLDLSTLRVVGCGAEPIVPEVLAEFIETFRPHGLRPEGVMPSYGLAEATVAVSFDSIERVPRELRIDRESYELQGRAVPSAQRARREVRLVSCGRAFPGHEIAIFDERRNRLADGGVGEIGVYGPSVTAGYFGNPAATAETFVDGWLMTGDLGVLHEGELYVCGRSKDLIIVNGRNYYPQDLEWIVERLEGVRPGGVAAFSIPGSDTERVIIVAETRGGDAALQTLIRREVQAEAGILPDEVILVARGGVPKSTSGKVQRRRARALYLDGRYSIPESLAEPAAIL